MPTLYSEISGRKDAPFLLLSNSLGATMTMWDPQMSLLEDYFRVIRYDTRGHGRSEAPEGPYQWAELVEDAFSVLDEHDAGVVNVMGISMGAMTALGMALARPNRIRRLVCVAGRADAPPPFLQSWDDRLAALERGGMQAVWDGTRPKWLTNQTQSNNPDAVGRLQDEFLKTDPVGYRGCVEALKRLDYLRHLNAVQTPVLAVSGSDDVAASPVTMKSIAEALPNGQYAEVPDAAHIVNIDNSSGFNLAIADFLDMNTH